LFSKGVRAEFKALSKSLLRDGQYIITLGLAFNILELPPLYFSRRVLFDHLINLSDKSPFV